MAGGGALLMFGDSSGNPSMSRGGFVDSRHFIVGTMTMGAGEAHRINEAVLGSKSWSHSADMFRQNLLRSGSGTVGISILDRYDHAENKIVSRAVAQSLGQLRSLVQNTDSGAILHPMFVDSRSSNIIQLVDVVTYIMSRHIGRDGDDEFAKRHRQLLPSIDRIINAKPWQYSDSGGPA